MTPNAELDALLDRAVGGDQASLVELLERVGPEVRRRIGPRIGAAFRSQIEEDDVMQVTYLEAVTRLSRFTGGGASGFLAWLTRLAENNLVDAVRSLESAKRPDPRKRVHAPRSHEESMVALVEMLGESSSTPSRMAAKGEASRFLDAALARLPSDYEKVVRLYDLHGKSVGEVASEMGRSEGAVYMMRARAHDQLRDLMGPDGRYFTNA